MLAYSTDCYIALNLEASPFNVGQSLRLPPFTLDQFLALGRCYQLSMMDSDRHRPVLEDLYQLIAGHLYLANLSFYALAEGQRLPDLFPQTDGIFRSHLQELASMNSTISTCRPAKSPNRTRFSSSLSEPNSRPKMPTCASSEN